MGILGIFTFFDPIRYFGVVIGLIILQSLRVYYRYVFREDIKTEFKTSYRKNFINIIILLYGVISFSFWLIYEYILK